MTDAQEAPVDAVPQESPTLQRSTDHIPVGFRETAGKGRVKGVPNTTTREAKQLAVMMANEQVQAAIEWLHRVGTDNPSRAFELYLDLLRLVIPQRSTAMSAEFVAGDSQSPFAMRFRGMFGNPPIESPP